MRMIISRVVVTLIDVTDRNRSRKHWRESEERYALAVRGATAMVSGLGFAIPIGFIILRWKNMLGYKEEDIYDTPDEWMGRVHAEAY